MSPLFDDDGATNDGDGDDDTDDTNSSADEVEPFVRVLGLLVASDRINKKLSDSAFTVLLEATHTLREPHFHASGDSDDNVDETLSIDRFSKFVEISHSRTEQVFHELGILAATNILSESQRNALTDQVVESIVDTEFFDVFNTDTNGWTLPLVEHTNPRPAALSDDTGDISASSAIPLLLQTGLITEAHFEAAIRDLWTRIQSVDNIRDAADELLTVGHLASHELLPSADANRILSDIHCLLNGDVDDTKRALKAIQYLAGSGIFDSERVTPLVEALIPLLDPQTADLAKESGQALSHLITAEVIQSAQINDIAATIFGALESGSGPVVRGATRTAAALTATGALSTERAADLFGYLVQLVTVKFDQTGTSEAIIHAGAAHALQGFAGNYDIPTEHINDVLGALAIAAHGSDPAYGINQGQRASLIAFHDIIKKTDIPDVDESILMPVLEVAVAQLQPDSQFETEPPDSELSRTAAQILRTLVDELLLDPLLLAGVLSIHPQDVTWIKNYPPDVIRAAARADLRRYLAPDNTTTAVLLQAVATAAASDPMPFDGARGQLLDVLRATAPTAEVKTAGIGVLLELSDRATTQN